VWRNQAAKSPQYGSTRTQDPGKLPADQVRDIFCVVHESQFNKFSHADGLKSIPLLKEVELSLRQFDAIGSDDAAQCIAKIRWRSLQVGSGPTADIREQRIAQRARSTEGTEKLHYRERHDQDAYGGHQPPGRNALNKPPPEWGRQHAAQYERNQPFQRHGANFRKECSCS
jgi:hypothetical protein